MKASVAEKVEHNRKTILACLDAAAAYRPDFVCFPEIMLQSGVGGFKVALPFAETVPGLTSEMVAARARSLGCHVVFCTIERANRRFYNTAVLIGRDGNIVGKYRKFHTTSYEMKDGITPGEAVPVWETDGGRVGCAICFDLKFPAVGLALSRGRAQVVFLPSMFYGGRRLAAWAMDYGFYIIRCHSSGGAIVDPVGNRIASEGPPLPLRGVNAVVKWTFAEVNADRKTYHLDFNREKLPALARKYGSGAAIDFMWEEGTFSLTSNLPGLSVVDLEREFGLQDLRAYLDEAEHMRAARLRARRRWR